MPKSNSVGCYRQLNSSSLHKQTRRNPLSGDVCFPVENHDMVPSLPDNSKSQAHSRVSECDGRPFCPGQTKSNQQNGHCIRRCSNRSVKVVHSSCISICHRLNHKAPLYVSLAPDQHAWDINTLNINWSGLTAYAYPPTAVLYRVKKKIRQCNCFVIVIAPGWPGMPWFWDLVQLSTEIPLQLPVSTTLLKQSHNQVFHSNPQHLNLHSWCPRTRLLCGSGRENFAAPQRSSTRTIYKAK